ncbi:MAG: class I SAM-dependent methyltransferase [Aureispira sp.]|nr:class I SAM-dependent methyltransferase [Aureispira sp.]
MQQLTHNGMSIRKIYYALPTKLRLVARRVFYWPLDTWESITGKRDKLCPPRGLTFIGSGDFIAQGKKVVTQMRQYGDLQPHHSILDVGCGIGRVAVPLTDYISNEGSYHGFDIMQQGIDWCKKNISSKYSNFYFKHASLQNDLYTLEGKDAAQFKFPYKDDCFDFVVLNSVFTHMIPSQFENYLSEIYRVLKFGGRCYATFFILTEESEKLLEKSEGFNFPHDYGFYRLMDDKVQSANIAFKEDYLTQQFTETNRFKIHHTQYGYWGGRDKVQSPEFQDIVILEK